MDHPEIGCYGNATYGSQYVRERLADTLEHFASANYASRGQDVPWIGSGENAYSTASICRDLRNPDTLTDGEEYDAVDWLNEHAPFDGASWGFQDGDFGLWPDDAP
jgi:hypothetical protein